MNRDYTKIKEQMEMISGLREEVNENWKKLDVSLRIEQLCPDAFEHGSCKASWQFVENAVVYQIKKGNGDIVLFPFNDVPDEFKNEEIERRDLNRQQFGRSPIEKALIRYKNNKYRQAKQAEQRK
jgi:hypothetical protein